MKCGSITGILKQNRSHCKGNRDAATYKKFQTQPSAGRIMAMVFWDLDEILLGLHDTQDNSYWACLCCCALEFKESHQRKMRESDRWVFCFFMTVPLYTSHKKESLT
jgi:hypothetical protein